LILPMTLCGDILVVISECCSLHIFVYLFALLGFELRA
jgi:hypothetical protein